MKRDFDRVGPLNSFGDTRWHVGLFRDGNCVSWASFQTHDQAEKWVQNPPRPAQIEADKRFSSN